MTTAEPSDELFHPVGDHPAWSESYYFNFVDPETGVGGITPIGLRPNDGWADALHAVYLPGGRVAFTYGRRTDLSPAVVDALGGADPEVGNLVLRRGEPFQRWDIVYRGPAQDMADPTVMLAATRDRPDGWARPAELDMAVTFEALAGPHYAVGGSQGHFEQTGRVSGTIRLGPESWPVNGFGVRDKSWGPRTWQAPSGSAGPSAGTAEDGGAAGTAEDGGAAGTAEGGGAAGTAAFTGGCFLNWFSMNFGPDLALGGACGRTGDGTFVGKGWIQRDGDTTELVEVTMTTGYDAANPLLHRTVELRATDTGGEAVTVSGQVVSICPTKIPRRDGVTFVNEGLARFTTPDPGGAGEPRTGWGIAEHWFAVPR